MTNGFIPQSSILLGIIPALILLYYSIKDWQGKFREKTLFIMFIIGIFSGFFVAIAQSQIIFTIELLIIYPFLEQIAKMIILNLRRFHEKQSTIIYGLALGLGFGSIYPPTSMILLSQNSTSNIEIFLILLGSIGLVFLHGATGAMIAYGIFKRKLISYYIFAVGILIISNLLRIDYKISYNIYWINFIFGILLFWFVYKGIIEKTINITEKSKEDVIK